MVVAGRRKSIAFFIALGAGLISVILLLYIGWVLLNWRNGILLFLGVLLLAADHQRRRAEYDFPGARNPPQRAARRLHQRRHPRLKTPVASIRLYLETLQTRAVDEAKRKEFYRIMLEDSDRLLATIEQILRTGRIGAASRKPNLSRIDLGGVVEECVARARALHHIPPESLRYHRRAAGHDPGRPGRSARGGFQPDRQRREVFRNGRAESRWRPAKVDEQVRRGARHATRAPGIPKTELKQIFKRFYRVPGPLATRVKGTGLGLYIVRSVAKRHGGRAWAESEGPGRGSTFVLQLADRAR